MRAHLGIGSHLAAAIASKVIVAAWKLAAKHLVSASHAAGSGDVEIAVQLLTGLMAEVGKAYGFEGGIDEAKIRSAVTETSWGLRG